jgi:hypothetical protein
MANRRDGPVAGAVIPASHHTQEVVRSRSKHRREEYHYHRHGQSQSIQTLLVEEMVVPVMLCHTCSHCGQMRSAGFHRNNPVVPGKPLVPTPCRRCKKKLKSSCRSSSRYTRVRKCTADEPCDWPREPFRVDNSHDECRGRRRSREEISMSSYSSSRPRVVKRESSVTCLGLGAFQQPSRKERAIRRSSSSPRPSSRYTSDVWPPPDIVRIYPKRADRTCSVFSEAPASRTARSDEVWPPPDIVRTQSYRNDEKRSLRRQSSRIVELTPSPPPSSRSRSTRFVYRSDSQERRPRSASVSPSRVRTRGELRSEEAEARLMSHPLPFRAVAPERKRASFRASDETSSNAESMPHQCPESPTCSILKPGSTDHDDTTYRRRASLRESEQSMHVEVGGPRVHFSGERRDQVPDPEPRGRSRYADGDLSSQKKSEHHNDYPRQRVMRETLPAPRQSQDFGKVRTRYCSPPRDRDYEEEIRMNKQRRISPSLSPTRLVSEFEEIRICHISPLSARRSFRRSSLSPNRPQASPPPPLPLYRHVSRSKNLDRRPLVASPPPTTTSSPPFHFRVEDDHTDSSSADSGDVTVVRRTWKGVDEDGRPATFVEERREVKMITEGSERGSVVRNYGDLGRGERLGVTGRVWRDV